MPQLNYQTAERDLMPDVLQAVVKVFTVELNVLRAAMTPPLPPLTRQDVLTKLKQTLRNL